MSHVHTFRYAPNVEEVSESKVNRPGFYCTGGCREFMLLPEAERRINATQHLTPEHIDELMVLTIELAQAVSRLTGDNAKYSVKKETDPFAKYARVLRGE